MTAEPHTFVGWVEHIFPATKYGLEFSARDHRDESDRPQYPITLKFNVGTKALPQVSSMNIGDKVSVRYFITGVSGNGRNGYYAINKLNVAKNDGVTIIQRSSVEHQESGSRNIQEAANEDDLPF